MYSLNSEKFLRFSLNSDSDLGTDRARSHFLPRQVDLVGSGQKISSGSQSVQESIECSFFQGFCQSCYMCLSKLLCVFVKVNEFVKVGTCIYQSCYTCIYQSYYMYLSKQAHVFSGVKKLRAVHNLSETQSNATFSGVN